MKKRNSKLYRKKESLRVDYLWPPDCFLQMFEELFLESNHTWDYYDAWSYGGYFGAFFDSNFSRMCFLWAKYLFNRNTYGWGYLILFWFNADPKSNSITTSLAGCTACGCCGSRAKPSVLHFKIRIFCTVYNDIVWFQSTDRILGEPVKNYLWWTLLLLKRYASFLKIEYILLLKCKQE